MKRRILIVDDNPTNLRLAASVLALEGYQVDQAQDAVQAQAYLESNMPDLILMDIALPGEDGLTLTRRIKADVRLRRIPVVALTAFAMKSDERDARAAGCVGYLSKPIDTRKFAEQVAGFFTAATTAPILIVDDNPTNLRLLRAQLEAEGAAVVEAEHGVEALERLAEEHVRGVVSDILMPRMDGYRLCMEVRRQPALADLPFVLYTSTYDSPADRTLAHSAGADAYISKPAPATVLLAALRAAERREREPIQSVAELETPVLKQYSESLIRKLEDKSAQLGEACENLAQTEARLKGLVESAMDGIITLDESQCIVLFNAAAERMFGCAREEALHASIDRFIPGRFQETHRAHVSRFGNGDVQARRMGARMVWAQRVDGTEFPVEATISRLGTSNGWLFTVFLRDVTERVRAEEALARSESRLRRVNRVLSVLSGINTLIVRVSDRDELLSHSCRIAVEDGAFPHAWIGLLDASDGNLHVAAAHGDDPARHLEREIPAPTTNGLPATPWQRAMDSMHPVVIDDLHAEPLSPQIAAVESARSLVALPLVVDARAVGVLVIHANEAGFFDSEEMDLLSELAGDIAFALDHLDKADRIRFLANYDPLTELPNRGQFTEYLGRALKSGNGTGDDTRLAVLLVDLERFRLVNQTRGRVAGDELLRQVGARLNAFDNSVARYSGDVFALKLRAPRTATDVAHACIELADRCFGRDYVVAGNSLRLGCRIGIAMCPTDGADADTLLHNAEAALRRARVASEPFVFYAPELNARAAEVLALESRLRGAIDRAEFVLHYQPKVAIADRRITGLEALIRWRDPEKDELVAPDRFIPVLEESGLIGVVGHWALQQALAEQAEWEDRGLVLPRVAVNVSPLQLRKLDFAADIAALACGRPTAALELEITESVMMDDVERNIAALGKVRSAGVTVAIDDFGTGYCSLAYIARLPITSLKIDRAFIVGMTSSAEGLAIVSSIIALAHSLRLRVVAEGVETEEQARLLHSLGCDEAQGFLFYRPMPASDVASLLRNR